MSEVAYRLLLLGPASLDPVDPKHKSLPPGKPLALLAFLACAPGRAASREQLIDLLWADAERDSARHTLRQTLWYVRRRLGVQPFETAGDTVRLVLPVQCDRDGFLAACEAGDWATAFEGYTGEFFPGFAAPGGAHFEQWADLERARLRSLFERTAESFLKQALIEQAPRDVVRLVRRARELAPDSPLVWRLLLEAMLAADDRVGAAAEADQLERWLEREELAPDASMRGMLKLVRNGTARATENDQDGLVAELVGREQALSLLLQRWEDAKAGSAGHLHLTGRAGLGKTRLLDSLARRLRAARARVVSVRALQANRDLPFSLAADLTLALAKLRGAAGISPDAASALVALAPGVSTYLSAAPDRSSGGDALRRRTLAIQELVTTIADDAPIALLVDDMHWADAESRAVLASLSAGLRHTPVLLVSAGRQPLAGGGEHVHAIPLDALSVDQVTALVESLATLPGNGQPGDWSDRFAQRLHAATDGSPLLVLETLLLATERGVLTRNKGEWHCTDADALTSTLAGGSAIRQRLLEVPETQRSTLTLLAVFGTEIEDSAVRVALGEAGADALAPLEVRGLIARQQGGWLVAHDEIAERVREMATPAQLIRAHRQCAAVLESGVAESPGTLLRAAHHRRDAGDRAELQQLFARFVRSNAADGDRRAIRALAVELLGSGATSAHVDALVRSLPWRVRHNVSQLFAMSVMGAAAMLALSVQLSGREAAVPPPARADVSIMVVGISGDDTLMYSAEVDRATLRSARELVLYPTDEVHPDAVRAMMPLSGIAERWTDTVVGMTLGYGAGYGIELMQVVLSTGATTRLTTAPTDDYGFSRSPDGAQAVFLSARADTVNELSGLYLLDRQSQALRRPTQSDAREVTPFWSPFDNRIAFVRRYVSSRPTDVCWLLASGGDPTCHTPSGDYELGALLGWDSRSSVLIVGEPRDAARSLLLRMDLQNGTTTALRDVPEGLHMESGGEFGMLMRSPPGGARQIAIMIDTRTPEREVPIRLSDTLARPLFRSVSFQRRRAPDAYLGTLRITPAPDTIRLDAYARLQVVAQASDGSLVQPLGLTWRSLDSTRATLSPTDGSVSPRTEGAVAIEVSATGYRPDTVALVVAAPRFDTDVLSERWAALDTTRWLPIGDPPVRVVRDNAGRRALLLDGDGHLASGLFQRTAVAARSGLGVETRIQLPKNRSNWQSVKLGFFSLASDAAVAEWGRSPAAKSPLQPNDWNDESVPRSCYFGAPRGEFGARQEQITFFAGGHMDLVKWPPKRLTDGAWHTVRIQIFADGRCGLALDGEVVAISRYALPLDQPLRLGFWGQSVGTSVLLGPLSAWRGERLDLPWFNKVAVVP